MFHVEQDNPLEVGKRSADERRPGDCRFLAARASPAVEKHRRGRVAPHGACGQRGQIAGSFGTLWGARVLWTLARSSHRALCFRVESNENESGRCVLKEGKERLIVALDVRTHDEAERLVDSLENVSFFKIGLRLFLAGDLYGLLERLHERRGAVFIDLKMAGDISNTITDFVEHAAALGIRFITLAESRDDVFTEHSLRAGRAARGVNRFPQFLMVPLLSSLSPANFGRPELSAEAYIVDRGREMVRAGCDGLIVSGAAIGACRSAFGPSVTLVSPGIRPTWSEADDHLRLTTPAEAIGLGADYLVVGRPIRTAAKPSDAAQRIIDEIDEELSQPGGRRARRAATVRVRGSASGRERLPFVGDRQMVAKGRD